MILCSCAVLRDRELAQAVQRLLDRDPYAVVTPGRVYHALGRRLVCHGCMPVVTAAIAAEIARRPPTAPASSSASHRSPPDEGI